MDYKFPKITHIDEVLSAIEGRRADQGGEFVVAKKDHYTVIDYVFCMPDSFPDPALETDPKIARDYTLRRECRGLMFDNVTGAVIGRRYHKFFNVGQKPETQASVVDFCRNHVVLEKLDGSMVSAFRTSAEPDRIRFATRMGETDVALQARDFVDKNPQIMYLEFTTMMINCGWTPIFEWCGRQNRVVVDHARDSLVLTGIRDNVNGEYMLYDMMCDIVVVHKIPVVRRKIFSDIFLDVQGFLDDVRGEDGLEGYVVRFENGHMVKVKNDWYCSLHNGIAKLAHEKDILEIVLTDRADDLASALNDQLRDKLLAFEGEVNRGISETCAWGNGVVFNFRVRNPSIDLKTDRRDFATWVLAQGFDPRLKALVFKIWEGADANQWIREGILSGFLGSQTRVDQTRCLIGGAKWIPVWMENDDA